MTLPINNNSLITAGIAGGGAVLLFIAGIYLAFVAVRDTFFPAKSGLAQSIRNQPLSQCLQARTNGRSPSDHYPPWQTAHPPAEPPLAVRESGFPG